MHATSLDSTHLIRAYRLLADVNRAIFRTTDEAGLLQSVCQSVIETGGYRFAWVGLAEYDAERSVRPVACRGDGAEYLAGSRISWGDSRYGQGPTGTAIRSGQAAICQDLASNERYHWRHVALHYGFAAMIALPLRVDDEILGALMIYAGTPQRFDDDEVALLNELSDNLAFGISALRAREQRREAEKALRESEARYRLLFEHNADALLLHEISPEGPGRILDVNDAACRHLGYTRDELLGMCIAEIDAPETLPNASVITEQTLTHCGTAWEGIHLTKKGRRVPVEIHNTILQMHGRDVAMASVHDISVQKQAERQALDALRFSQTMIAASPISIMVFEPSGQCITANEAAAELVGGTIEQIRAQNFHHIPSWRESGLLTAVETALASHTPQLLELHFTTTFGKEIWASCRLVPFVYNDEWHLLAMTTDIAERKKAEAALYESEQRYRLLAENASDVIWMMDLTGQMTYVSQAVYTLRGYTREEVMRQSLAEILSPSSLAVITPLFAQIARANSGQGAWPEPSTLLLEQPCKDGATVWTETIANYLRDDQGIINGIIGVTRDITERRRAAAALETETERLQVTLRSIGDGVIATDIEGRVMLLNRVAEKLTGWPQTEAIGHPLTDVFAILHAQTRQVCENPVTRVLQTGETVELASHTLLIARDGTERIITDSGAPIRDHAGQIVGVVLVFRDETGAITLRQEIQRIAKMESLGVMAGGIAHDFNNILTAITGNIGLAEMDVASKDQTRLQRHLRDAERASLRARDLTQQLLTFAKGGAPLRETIALPPLLQEAANLALTGSRCRCTLHAAPDLWPVDADAGQISQVLHNLLINADQAMPEGGQILLSAGNLTIDTQHHLPLPPGPYVRIDVQDDGVGIPPEMQEKIFDPFFTTKQRGSGLGLASVYSIIHGHNGHVGVTSMPGAGSTFSVYLPAHPAKAVPDAANTPHHTESRTCRILVLDDEAMITGVLLEILTRAGHTVSAVTEGAAAIAAWTQARKQGHPFDLAILDLTIPGGIGGEEVVAHLRSLDPRMRAIASSGYATDPIMANYRQYGFVGRLAKPYRMRDVLEVIDQVLGKEE